MDEMKQPVLRQLQDPVMFTGYDQMRMGLLKTLNELGVESGIITIVNTSENQREAGKARGMFSFCRKGSDIEVEAFGMKGRLWPESEFKKWWQAALAAEKTQLNLNYGFFEFKLSKVGPTLPASKRSEVTAQESDAREKPVPPMPTVPEPVYESVTQTPAVESQPSREELRGPEVSEEVILAEFRTWREFTHDALRLFDHVRKESGVDFRMPTSLFLYAAEGGDIIGSGYPLVHPSQRARIVKIGLPEGETSIFAPGSERALIDNLREQGIEEPFSLVVTRQQLPDY